MTKVEIDLVNRDPNNVNSGLQVAFEDVLAEPEAYHSIDCVWKCANTCFNCGKNIIYKILTLFTGICIALQWGCTFGCCVYNQVWIIVPWFRFFDLALMNYKRIYITILQCMCDPLCETLSILFQYCGQARK